MSDIETPVSWLKEKIKEHYSKEGKLKLAHVLNMVNRALEMEKDYGFKLYEEGRKDKQLDIDGAKKANI